MRLARTVYVLQLVVPFAMPWLFFLGRTAIGAPAGWLSGFGFLMLGPLLTIALGIPALLTLRDRGAYRARAASRPYSIATVTTWGALLVSALAIVEEESDPAGSLLTTTWAGVDLVASQYLFFVLFMVAVAAWASAMWFAITGLIEDRRSRL